MSAYTGRFAPSPSGPLHAGSIVAALGSWLDARAHDGRWLLRIEDVDGPRTQPGAETEILRQLQALGLRHDGPVLRQSTRAAAYQKSLAVLKQAGHAYACACTRQEIDAALQTLGRITARGAEKIYPGTCRGGLPAGRRPRAWRLRAGDEAQHLQIAWHDRRLGAQQQDVTDAVGDFVLQRADGPWAYQLAVVVDDADQQISDVVRGEDLADNTARQIHLQGLLGLPTPRYLHLPLVLDAHGEKLSKSKGATALVLDSDVAALKALQAAAAVLGLPRLEATTVPDWLGAATMAWKASLPSSARS